MLQFSDLTREEVVANQCEVMEADTISKNGRSSKSLTSRGNFIRKTCFAFVLMTALFAVTTTDVFAQVQEKFRGGLDAGLGRIFPITEGKSKFVPLADLNLGYNLNKNMTVGIKVGANLGDALTFNYDDYPYKQIFSFTDILNFTGTYTYYFGTRTNLVVPFIGGGLGLYVMKTRYDVHIPDYLFNRSDLSPVDKLGGFFTAGVEIGKFRVSARYDLLPVTTVTLYSYDGSSPSITEKLKNNYVSVNVGFYIGGGNRKKAAAVQEREQEEKRERERLAALEREKAEALEREKIALEREKLALAREQKGNVAQESQPVAVNTNVPPAVKKTDANEATDGLPITKGKILLNAGLSNFGVVIGGGATVLSLYANGGYFVADKLALIGGFGYDLVSIDEYSENSIALNAGARYYLLTASKGGLYMNGLLNITKESDLKAEFGFSISAGYSFFLNNRVAFEPSAGFVIPFTEGSINTFVLGGSFSIFF